MKYLRSHPRFFIAVICAFIAFIAIGISFSTFNSIEKILICFNVYLWVYVLLLLIMIKRARPERIKKFAESEDENTSFLILTSITSTLIAFIAIAMELSKAHDFHANEKLVHLILPTTTLIGAWILIPALFAIHYAHLFYIEKSDDLKIIKFPDNPTNPDYIDFLYFSITISVAAQTADISINNSRGRKLVLLQSVFSFAFNTSILAMGINVAASLLN